MRRNLSVLFATLLIFSLFLSLSLPSAKADQQDVQQFLRNIVENQEFTQVTLPLFQGTSHGQTVWYVITDSSNRQDAAERGVNFVPKLNNARNTAAVQKVHIVDGKVDFPATVKFGLKHEVVPGTLTTLPPVGVAAGFPPSATSFGAEGEAAYSPLIELPDGLIINAPQIANDSGQADKVIELKRDKHQVVYKETHGFYDHFEVHYASFDSSDPLAAALEDVTFAPNLNAAPLLGDESSRSSREGLIAFTNGQTGVNNSQRQGLSSAILDNLDPLNILHEVPEAENASAFGEYSPLWDVRLAQWTQTAIDQGRRGRKTDFDSALDAVKDGFVVGFNGTFNGTKFQASGFIVNCPVMSLSRSETDQTEWEVTPQAE